MSATLRVYRNQSAPRTTRTLLGLRGQATLRSLSMVDLAGMETVELFAGIGGFREQDAAVSGSARSGSRDDPLVPEGRIADGTAAIGDFVS